MVSTQETRIESVEFVRQVDDSPDTSYLGEYSSEPGPDDRTIDREERNDCGRNEYRYFIAAMSAEETGNPESVEQDYRRMETLNRGDWCYVGCFARATVYVNGIRQRIQSGGLWGIESDSEPTYFDEIRDDELAGLREVLQTLGFDAEQIDAAFEDVSDSE